MKKSKYETADEIRAGFISEGWNDPHFILLEEGGKYFETFKYNITKGKKYFVMIETGNVYDEKGKIAMYDIPVCKPTPICR